MSWSVLEMPSCYSETMRKARKKHRCCECRGSILPGESYRYKSGIWEGRPDSFKTCVDCEQLRKEIDSSGPLSDVGISGLADWIDETRVIEQCKRFLEIKRKRAATVPSWLEKEVQGE